MIDYVQGVGIVAALLSAVFWGLGAGIRIPPITLWRFTGKDPTTIALHRQSLMNAFAAIAAAITAICQAIVLYVSPA